jgi:hypothetical protein
MTGPEIAPVGEGGYERITSGETTWLVDRDFLSSNWSCIYGRGCLGILDHRAPELAQGCCSVGAELDGEEEANLISALAATLDEGQFQFHAEAGASGVFSDDTRHATRVHEGACIFLNRPGFAGGVGCALHLAALALGDSPIGLKPSVCWQLPVHVDFVEAPDGGEVATLRAWRRSDWGDEGATMAWCCTEDEGAFVGESRVIDSLGEELEEIVGHEVYVELRRRIAPPPPA